MTQATYDDISLAELNYDTPAFSYEGEATLASVAIKSRATKVQDYLGIGTPGDRQ